jgi:hypothetical protein
VDKTKVTDNAATNAAKAAAAANPTVAAQTIGLGIDGGLDLLSKTTAAHADVVMQGAMALIKQAYGNLNTPAGANAAAPIGSGPDYLQSQLAGYQTALAFLNTLPLTPTNTTSTSGTTGLFF